MKDAASRLSLASLPCYVRIGAWVLANSVQSLTPKSQAASGILDTNGTYWQYFANLSQPAAADVVTQLIFLTQT